MEHYIGVLADEGVTFVPIWTEPPEAAKAKVTADLEVKAKEEAAEVEKDSEKKKAEGGLTVAQVSMGNFIMR